MMVLVAGGAGGPRGTPPDIALRVESATTRADHALLALYYFGEAAPRATLVNHRPLGKSYLAARRVEHGRALQ